jgi:Ca2+/H+ antiporter
VLIVTYLFVLLFQLKTHAKLFSEVEVGIFWYDDDHARHAAAEAAANHNKKRRNSTPSDPLASASSAAAGAVGGAAGASDAVSDERTRLSPTQPTKRSSPGSPSPAIADIDLTLPPQRSGGGAAGAAGAAASAALDSQRSGGFSESDPIAPNGGAVSPDGGVGGDAEEEGEPWSVRKAVAVLVGATVIVSLLSEVLTAQVDVAGRELGLSEEFLGCVIVAIVGNVAEHASAVVMAYR